MRVGDEGSATEIGAVSPTDQPTLNAYVPGAYWRRLRTCTVVFAVLASPTTITVPE